MYRTLPEANDDVLGFAIEGRLTEDEVTAMQRDISQTMDRHGSVRMLVRISGLDDVEPSAVWQDMKMTPDYARDVDRLAVVGDASWHEWVSTLGKPFAEVAYFEPDDMARAWSWVRGEGSATER